MKKIILAATALAGFAAPAMAGDMMLGTDSFASGLASGAALAPGDITVRMRAQMWVEGSYVTDTFQKTSTGKNSGVLMDSYVRLYPKFDAKTAGGLQYGAQLEIRMNSGTGAGSSGSNTLYAKRYVAYLGTDSLGRLYLGPELNAIGRVTGGFTMEDFDYNGGFNGDIPYATSNASPGNSALLNWVSGKGSGFYSTNKIVYVTPSFSGVTMAVAYEPSQSSGESSLASGGTLNPTTSSYNGSSNLRRNTVDFGVRWAGSVGPLAVAVGGGYITAGRVIDTNKADVPYRNLSFGDVGTRVTYGPFAVGGNVNFGAIDGNSGGTMLRQGQRNGVNAIFGAQYIIGPVIMGFQYVVNTSGGNYNQTTAANSLHEYGIMVGGGYDFAPGATLYGDVFYDQRHQYGWNFLTGAGNTGTTVKTLSVNNRIQARGFQIGTAFKW